MVCMKGVNLMEIASYFKKEGRILLEIFQKDQFYRYNIQNTGRFKGASTGFY